MSDLVLVLRYRKAVTYGFHALLGALETHETATRYEVVFAESVPATIAAIQATSAKTLVLWSFYSPDFAALTEELATIKKSAPGAVHIAGGVHATADPTRVPGLAYRNSDGEFVKTGRVERKPLDEFRAFSLRWNRFSALEITRGCVYACQYKRRLLRPSRRRR